MRDDVIGSPEDALVVETVSVQKGAARGPGKPGVPVRPLNSRLRSLDELRIMVVAGTETLHTVVVPEVRVDAARETNHPLKWLHDGIGVQRR